MSSPDMIDSGTLGSIMRGGTSTECKCAGCARLLGELEADIMKLNTMTANLADKCSMGAATLSSRHVSEQIDTTLIHQRSNCIVTLPHISSLASSTTQSVHQGIRLPPEQDTPPVWVSIKSQDHQKVPKVTFPQTLLHRAPRTRSFAHTNNGLDLLKIDMHSPSRTSNIKPAHTHGSHRPTRKLKLHSLWEEAYAMAEEDVDYVDQRGSNQDMLPPRWMMSSKRTILIGGDQIVGLYRMMANPHSHAHLLWDCFGIVLILYDLASIPVEIAWDIKKDGTPWWLTSVEIAYWTIDMLLSFIRGYYDKGMLVWQPGKVTRRYLKTWFIFDLVLLLVDCMFLFSKVMELTALASVMLWVRLVRMWRMLKLRQAAKKLEDACQNHTLTLVHAVIYTSFVISILTHMIACAWYYIGDIGRSAGNQNWIDEAVSHDLIDRETLVVEYLFCFHWVLGQFTPAPAPVSPSNWQERAFTIIVIFFTLFVLGKEYQKMSRTVQELNANRHEGNRIRRQVQMFLAMHKVPLDLAIRTTRFADHVLSRRAQIVLDSSLISEHLHRELKMHQRQGYLVEHPLFKLIFGASTEVASNVCESLQQHSYDKGRVIFATGSVARCMYITLSGGFYMQSEDSAEVIESTRYFAELALYCSSMMHSSTLQATTFSDAFTFAAADFKRAVQHSPHCSCLVLEYANALLGQVRRDATTQQLDSMHLDRVTCAVEATRWFKMMNAEDVVELPRSLRELRTHSEVDNDEHLREGVLSLLVRLRNGQLPSHELVPQLEATFPEVHPDLGVYARLLYQDERLRTLVSMANVLWLWSGNYDAFTAPQSIQNKMSMDVWRKLQGLLHWVQGDDNFMHVILVMIAIRGTGNIKPIVKELPPSHQRTAKAVAYMLLDSGCRFDRQLPSVQALPDEMKQLLAAAFELHDSFNLGQFMEGENLPLNILQLHEAIARHEEGDMLLKLYLLGTVGVMSGRDARTEFEMGHTATIPGSRFIDEHRGKMLLACIDVLEQILTSTPQAIYWSYMCWFAMQYQIAVTTDTELAMTRFLCLGRAHSLADFKQMQGAWNSLQEVDRALLTDCLLADGISQRSIRFLFLPKCLANARGNINVGLGPFMRVLAELLELVKLQGCWEQTESTSLSLDLQELANFIASVNNLEVFSTCLLRAELRQFEAHVNVVMTSRNWVRAQDTDNHEVAVSACIHNVYHKQRCLEFVLDDMTRQASSLSYAVEASPLTSPSHSPAHRSKESPSKLYGPGQGTLIQVAV